ncbi:MAG: PPC domain-containing DNA-binding protein, partial [Actinomycetota bacterium]
MQIKKICLLLTVFFIAAFCVNAQIEQASAKKMRIFALRLKPNQDLRLELEKFTKENKISAGLIITAVGSLKETKIRLADQSDTTSFEGKFEIVSLVGTLSDANRWRGSRR